MKRSDQPEWPSGGLVKHPMPDRTLETPENILAIGRAVPRKKGLGLVAQVRPEA